MFKISQSPSVKQNLNFFLSKNLVKNASFVWKTGFVPFVFCTTVHVFLEPEAQRCASNFILYHDLMKIGIGMKN